MELNRIRTLILMLGSDQTGEVASAAAMLIKALNGGGKDLHWLANNVTINAAGDATYDGRSAAAWADECRTRETELAKVRRSLAQKEIELKNSLSRVDELVRVVDDQKEQLRLRQTSTRQNGSHRPPWSGAPWRYVAAWCVRFGGSTSQLREAESTFLHNLLERSTRFP